MTNLEDSFELRGHRAVVTGASSGLGEVARRLEPHGIRTISVPGDLADLASIPAVFERCEQALGSIDILVNNAGLLDSMRAEKTTVERWSRMLDVNVSAAFLLCQEFAKHRFARSEPGRIVNVGSIFGAVASSTPGLAPCAATKGAITMLTRQLAIEWGSRGITVNALAPGFFPTELNLEDFERPGVRERVEAFIPLGRPGELAAALLFLVSPTASYVTGSIVFVDGGYTAW